MNPLSRPFLVVALVLLPGSALEARAADWTALKDAPRSALFRARVSDMNLDRGFVNDHPWLSEELLFIQSNTRVLVCQNPRGELRHLALPTRVYPVPNGALGYSEGMYHHFDTVTADHVSYRLRLEGQSQPRPLVPDDAPNETFYAHDVLPVTRAQHSGLDITVAAFAPVAPDPLKAALAPAPLPGPAAALYVARLENRTDAPIRGALELVAPRNVHGRAPETTLRRDTLIQTVSDGSVGLRLAAGTWSETDEGHVASRPLALEPGESVVVESVVALAPSLTGIMPVVYEMYMRSGLDWLEATMGFWHVRLGALSVDAADLGREARVSRDLYVRCMLDNFCCLQTDAAGTLVSHYQGAPKPGTIWGIDYEPTLVSILPLVPELARQGLLFTLDRNRAPRSRWPEHSVPILVSPVIIARKYLETTGDIALFTQHLDVLPALESVFVDLESLKAASHRLYPSRYSSDGEVGRRYDHGTNAKVWSAFDSFRVILEALGDGVRARSFGAAADEIRRAIEETMVVDGPFGPQISGGTNLGEDPGDFYLPEDVLYYDGEDSGSHLAPIYGVYGLSFEPWVNYHRFARSLFNPTWEPEYGTLRWYPSWSMPVLDGTGFFSVLGGSRTRAEMSAALRRMHEHIADPTGSVYWWPVSSDFRRGLSRCSQGQGSWARQYGEQWLGLRADALSKVLTVAPRGLPSEYEWKGFRAGGQVFDIQWREEAGQARLEVTNRGPDTWTVRLGARPYGAGTEGSLSWTSASLEQGHRQTLRVETERLVESSRSSDVVAEAEAARYAENGVVFRRYGPLDPFPDWYELWPDTPLDLRFYVLNATGDDWEDAVVRILSPPGWRARGRPARSWPPPVALQPEEATVAVGPVPAGASATAAFQLRGPHRYDTDLLTEGRSHHFPAEAGIAIRLPTAEVETEQTATLEATLQAGTARGRRVERRLVIPLTVQPAPGH